MIALLLALNLLQEPGGSVPPFDPSKTITSAVLEEEIDHSLHWLRARFDPAKGSFGSVESDVWALLAFATSPRKYRATEGPFIDQPLAKVLAAQAADGSFGGNKVVSLAAADALTALNVAPEAREKARAFGIGAPQRPPDVKDGPDAQRRAAWRSATWTARGATERSPCAARWATSSTSTAAIRC